MILLGKNPGIPNPKMNVDVGGLKEDADATDYMATAGLKAALHQGNNWQHVACNIF
jgi:hypothetical protein